MKRQLTQEEDHAQIRRHLFQPVSQTKPAVEAVIRMSLERLEINLRMRISK
jgi:hypothetical protein